MKFIHTSDWHIGKLFKNISLIDDQRHVLDQIITYIDSNSVDALLIAGDIYDRTVPPTVAVDLLDEVFDTICSQLNVPIILIPGNHDSAARLNFGSKQLQRSGLYILGKLENITQPVSILDAEIKFDFYGVPYNDPVHVRNSFETDIKTYDEANQFLIEKITSEFDPDAINILLSHCFAVGGVTSDSERTLSIGGSDQVSVEPFKAFDYVALGHLHGPQKRERPHIRYSGSPLKYSFSEADHKKSVTLVEYTDGKPVTITQLPLTPMHEVRRLKGKIEDIMIQGRKDPNNEDYLEITITNNHAVLDPMNKLRQVYPNVLELRKDDGVSINQERIKNRKKLSGSPLNLFKEFYQAVTDKEVTQEQEVALTKTINTVNSTDLQ